MKWWYENEEEMKSCEHCSHEDCKNIGGTWYCLDCPECGVNWEKKMEFDKSRVYTALNADELKAGDKVIVADQLSVLKQRVQEGKENSAIVLRKINGEDWGRRFGFTMSDYALAYLVERKENCTNCEKFKTGYCIDGWDVDAQKIFRCENYTPKTKQKAEPHYRPFKDTDELIKVWNKKFYLDFKPSHDPLTMPSIWVRQKECSKGGLLITYFGEDEVKTDMGFLTMSKLLSDYTFTDGFPCGVEE